MKKFIKPALTLMVVGVAAFGAFAFKAAPAKDDLIDVYGMLPDCSETEVLCSTTGQQACKSGLIDLYHWNENETDCDVQLFRKQP